MNNEIEKQLFNELVQIIEQGKNQISRQVNSTITMVYWHLGKKINDHVLVNKRAEYGKQIVPILSKQLVKLYGRSFTERNLRRMMQFSEEFSDITIVTSLMTQLSWSHFLLLLPLKSNEEKLFYPEKTAEESLGITRN